MKTVRDAFAEMFTGRSARPVHWTCGSVTALVTWAMFGTVDNVMHFGAYFTMLFWLGLADFGGCFYRYFWPNLKVTHPAKSAPAAVSADEKDEMEKAA